MRIFGAVFLGLMITFALIAVALLPIPSVPSEVEWLVGGETVLDVLTAIYLWRYRRLVFAFWPAAVLATVNILITLGLSVREAVLVLGPILSAVDAQAITGLAALLLGIGPILTALVIRFTKGSILTTKAPSGAMTAATQVAATQAAKAAVVATTKASAKAAEAADAAVAAQGAMEKKQVADAETQAAAVVQSVPVVDAAEEKP